MPNKWYSVTGKIEWFTNTPSTGQEWKGRYTVDKEQAQAASKAAAVDEVLKRLKASEKWADGYWLGYSVDIISQ